MADLVIWKKKHNFTVARNHEYMETYSMNSVQSSLKSHPLCVRIYIQSTRRQNLIVSCIVLSFMTGFSSIVQCTSNNVQLEAKAHYDMVMRRAERHPPPWYRRILFICGLGGISIYAWYKLDPQVNISVPVQHVQATQCIGSTQLVLCLQPCKSTVMYTVLYFCVGYS